MGDRAYGRARRSVPQETHVRRSRHGFRKILTAVFAVGFVVSFFSTISAFAAANIFKIQNAELGEFSTTAEGYISSFDEQEIVSNVTFHTLNDSVKYTISLKNTDSIDHVIYAITDDNTNPYITYEYDSHASEQINAGEDLVFEVVAKYTTVASISERAQASSVHFLIDYQDIDKTDSIDINPNTSDTINRNVLILIASAIGLVIIGVVSFKSHKKVSKIAAVLLAAVSIVTVSTTVKAVTTETNTITLTSEYSLKDKLIVTWTDANGDNHQEIVTYNEPIDIPEQTKPGQTFTGWEDENGNPVDPTQPFTEDITIRPVFRTHTYTIRFDGNGADGSMSDMQLAYDETTTLTESAFAFTGRTYAGWDTMADGSGVHYDDGASVVSLTAEDNGVVTLYAQWSVNPFYVEYNGNGATSGDMATTSCEYDQACTLRENTFARYGYDFAGWKYNDTDYADKADVTNLIESGAATMVAQWTLHNYSITYLDLTSDELSSLNNPTSYNVETPSFTLKKPNDRYDADGDKTQHFEGWREETVILSDVTLPAENGLGDKIFRAIWSNVATPTYNVYYDYADGDVETANPTTFTKFDTFTLNEPIKEGYTFTGWTGTDIATETKPYTVPTGVRHDLEFTAHYRENNYTIVFDGNEATSGTTASMSMKYDEAQNLTANGFVRTGYTFDGWNTQADGEGTSYADEQEVKNLTAEDGATITLYAKWNPTQYTIIFHANNENVENPDAMAAQVVTYDVETTLNPLEYTWWQHKLVEWTTNANGTGTKYADKATIKNLNANGGEVHLYAKWREIDAALKAGGVGVSPTGRNINALLTANPDAKRFVKYTAGTPSAEVLANAVDTSGTIDPIWLWVEGENLYWWSEDVKPRISHRTDTDCLFNGAGTYTVDGATKHLEYADLTGFDTSNITNYGRTFHSSGILEINISDWDFSHATNMSEFIAFGSVKKATFPEVVDARNVTNMYLALNFGMVTDVLDLSGWKTRDVRNLSSFLSGMKAEKIKFSSDFKTNNVENMASMFYGNSRLTSIEGLEYFDTAKVKNMSNMFASVSSMESLDLSTFSTAALTNMKGMFSGMSNLTSLTLGGSFKANDVTDFTNAFKGLTKLQTIDLSNLTSIPTDMSNMFESSSAAKTIDISGMDLSAVTKFTYTFIACGNLETIYVSNNPNQENITDDGHIFLYSGPKIVGGAGSNHLGSAAGTGNGGGSGQSVYARIDDPDNGNPGYFTLKGARYVRYHDNDDDTTNDEANYALMTSGYLKAGDSLKKNTFARSGYVFTGWKDADNNEYTDEQVMTDLTESKTPLELYAQWKVPVVDFIPADELRLKMTSLATNDNNIKQFIPYPGTPDLDSISYEIVSTSESDFPIYMWYDSNSNAIYYWCEWERPRMSGVLTDLFSTTSNIEKVDFSAIDLSEVTSAERLFSQKTKLKSVDFGNWDASNVTNMYRMFYYASSLETVDLSNFNTTNLQGSLEGMFDHCTSLKSIDFGNTFKTDNITSMHTMFQDNTSLEELDLSSFNTSNVETMYYMFANDTNLASIDFGSNFNTANVANMGWMFFSCKSLNMLDLSAFSSDRLTTATAMFRFAPLQTIYVTSSFNLESIDETTVGGQMTFANTNLIGGMGTSFVATDHKGASYGRIDDPDNGAPGYFTIKGARYVRYHDNDGDTTNDETNYALMKSEYLKAGDSLKKNAFTRDGYVFTGWKDADNNEYTDEQVMADLAESKTPLELYAQWDTAPYAVTFDANGGEVLQSTKTVTYLQPYDELPTPVRYNYADSMLRGKYGFKEWNTKADGSGDTITSSSIYTNTNNTTLYAIWNDQFTITIYNGESETPTIASYRKDDVIDLNAQNVAGKQFLYWEVDGAKKSYLENYQMYMYQGKDLTIRAIYGSESDLESQQPGTYISDIYRQYSSNKIVVRAYSYVPNGYENVEAGVIATLDANIANGTFDDQTATYKRVSSPDSNNYYFTWTKSNVTSEQTIYVKAYLKYKDADGVEHTMYGDLVTATLTE